MPIQTVNPATNKLLRSFDALTPEALESKLTLAAEAARTYPAETLADRTFWMRRLAILLEHDLEDLAELMTLEMGKTLSSARLEVKKCASCCRYYAENAAKILTPEPIETEHQQSFVRYDPLGVVLAVMPWNFPLWQVFRFLAPALMAGNVGLLKHASNVPQCALAIEALTRRAGFPRGTFQTLLIEARQVEAVLADPRVAAVTVTGSEAAGRAVAAQAGWLIKKSVLELGGCDPFIVMSSAAFEEAVANAVRARCINSGQSCIAAKRFIIHDAIYDRFADALVQGFRQLRVGDPLDPKTQLGPLAHARGLETLERQVRDAVQSGAKILTGGRRIGTRGFFYEPTVLANLPREAPVAREEMFGPVALLFRARDLEDALAIANDTTFGLGASIWSRDQGEQERAIAGLESGQVFVNAMVASSPELPFGGTKLSGYGRELGAVGLYEFVNAKSVRFGES
jgi:succinate-semialdehyde dehydrogenase / glutarate-semialdehyde dehydrogenase